MSVPVSISSEVAAEILSIAAYYEGLKEGLGEAFEGEVEALLAKIQANPDMYPKEFGPIHRAVIRRFSMAIFYVARPASVVVVEVRDSRREPPDWPSQGFQDN